MRSPFRVGKATEVWLLENVGKVLGDVLRKSLDNLLGDVIEDEETLLAEVLYPARIPVSESEQLGSLQVDFLRRQSVVFAVVRNGDPQSIRKNAHCVSQIGIVIVSSNLDKQMTIDELTGGKTSRDSGGLSRVVPDPVGHHNPHLVRTLDQVVGHDHS